LPFTTKSITKKTGSKLQNNNRISKIEKKRILTLVQY
jgi:hypothetical protein